MVQDKVGSDKVDRSHKSAPKLVMLALSKMVSKSFNTHASVRRKRWLHCAAAVGSLAGSSHAFMVVSPLTTASSSARSHVVSPHSHASHNSVIQHSNLQTRLFFSKKEDDDWSNLKRSAGNLVKKGAEKIKSILPFGKTEEEKQAAMIKREQKEALNSMMKDLPFPIRMAGKMIAPLLSNVAQELAQQSKAAQGVLEEARVRLVNDDALISELGEPLQVGQPFSQSSSSMSINGKSTTKVQASFQVAGPYGSGVATMDSSNNEITSLIVNVNGRSMSIRSRSGNAFRRSSAGNRAKDDDVIEAEIIEKK